MMILLAAILILGMALRGIGILSRRGQQMRAVASRLGLRAVPDNSLPRGLSLHGTPFFQPTRLTNIYEGIISGHEVVILDFKKREDESAWATTIVAIKTRHSLGQPARLECRKAGAWQLISPPIGLMDSTLFLEVERIEFILKNIARYES